MEQRCPEIFLNKATVARDKRLLPNCLVLTISGTVCLEKLGTDEANFGYAVSC
jgi:hypothetical protein